ncbi:YqjF family protein [Niabella sp. 22666]|uniref:YqjF family protein n=1 Tax=Niabella sp. 22666 TaxID=3453954 RepID=UPI003F86559B
MSTFLSAEWRKLAMANYAIDPDILKAFVPYKTELDTWNNTCYVSLVGFMFLQTKLLGMKIPGHVNFEEVNLRFYVRYKEGNNWKRGVVFIKEIVPKTMIAWVANNVYGENYEALPMRHNWQLGTDKQIVSYGWKKQQWHEMIIHASSTPQDITTGSEAEFITEHYWGYTQTGLSKTGEYEVQHPRWQTYEVTDYTISVDFELSYGPVFGFLNNWHPRSVLLAEGSAIKVLSGKRIR